MHIKLIGVHPFTHDSDVKELFCSLPYPVEVSIEKVGNRYDVVYPKEYEANVAWFLTDDELVNEWVKKYWDWANQFKNH